MASSSTKKAKNTTTKEETVVVTTPKKSKGESLSSSSSTSKRRRRSTSADGFKTPEGQKSKHNVREVKSTTAKVDPRRRSGSHRTRSASDAADPVGDLPTIPSPKTNEKRGTKKTPTRSPSKERNVKTPIKKNLTPADKETTKPMSVEKPESNSTKKRRRSKSPAKKDNMAVTTKQPDDDDDKSIGERRRWRDNHDDRYP
jgi:RNA polymerase primary sigma factor